jgi:hypothetical protein
MSPCPNQVAWSILVDYWADDLPDAEAEAVEAHVFGCATCAAESARVAAIGQTLRGLRSPVVTREALATLAAQGKRIFEDAFVPGDRREILFPADADLLIFRLSGLDLAGAEHVSFSLRSESKGELLVEIDRVPFERGEGSVLLACERHYASLPPDIVAELHIHEPAGERVATYTILHRFA